MKDKPIETNAQREIREELEHKANDKADPPFSSAPDTAIDSAKYEMLNMALMDYFNLKSEDWETNRDELSVIREWAEVTARSIEKVEILEAIKYLEEKVVSNGVASNRLHNLYRWIRLDLDTKRLEREKQLYEQ